MARRITRSMSGADKPALLEKKAKKRKIAASEEDDDLPSQTPALSETVSSETVSSETVSPKPALSETVDINHSEFIGMPTCFESIGMPSDRITDLIDQFVSKRCDTLFEMMNWKQIQSAEDVAKLMYTHVAQSMDNVALLKVDPLCQKMQELSEKLAESIHIASQAQATVENQQRQLSEFRRMFLQEQDVRRDMQKELEKYDKKLSTDVEHMRRSISTQLNDFSNKTVHLLENQKNGLQQTCQTLRQDCQVLQQDCQVLQQDCQVLQQDCQALRQDYQILQQDCQGLRQKVETQKDLSTLMSKQVALIVETASKSTKMVDGEQLQKQVEPMLSWCVSQCFAKQEENKTYIIQMMSQISSNHEQRLRALEVSLRRSCAYLP